MARAHIGRRSGQSLARDRHTAEHIAHWHTWKTFREDGADEWQRFSASRDYPEFRSRDKSENELSAHKTPGMGDGVKRSLWIDMVSIMPGSAPNAPKKHKVQLLAIQGSDVPMFRKPITVLSSSIALASINNSVFQSFNQGPMSTSHTIILLGSSKDRSHHAFTKSLIDQIVKERLAFSGTLLMSHVQSSIYGKINHDVLASKSFKSTKWLKKEYTLDELDALCNDPSTPKLHPIKSITDLPVAKDAFKSRHQIITLYTHTYGDVSNVVNFVSVSESQAFGPLLFAVERIQTDDSMPKEDPLVSLLSDFFKDPNSCTSVIASFSSEKGSKFNTMLSKYFN